MWKSSHLLCLIFLRNQPFLLFDFSPPLQDLTPNRHNWVFSTVPCLSHVYEWHVLIKPNSFMGMGEHWAAPTNAQAKDVTQGTRRSSKAHLARYKKRCGRYEKRAEIIIPMRGWRIRCHEEHEFCMSSSLEGYKRAGMMEGWSPLSLGLPVAAVIMVKATSLRWAISWCLGMAGLGAAMQLGVGQCTSTVQI